MCFSAPASFAAAAVLTVAGSYTLKKTSGRSKRVFASIPLLFSAQQFFEGFVWLSLKDPEWAQAGQPSILAFLFFAEVIWPLYVPVSMVLLEKNKQRKNALLGLACMGGLFSLLLLWGIAFFPVQASIYKTHILYEMHYPNLLELSGSITYFLATVLSLFISSHPRMHWLGLIILASFLISKIWFTETLISVWCYFAAVASIVVHFILHPLSLQDTVHVKPDNDVS